MFIFDSNRLTAACSQMWHKRYRNRNLKRVHSDRHNREKRNYRRRESDRGNERWS